jgi:hypothetical protein
LQIRIVTGQPWDARADVLVAPVVGDPDFSGPLGELDRRAGGGLSGLHAFGELRGKRFSTSLASGGGLPASPSAETSSSSSSAGGAASVSSR